MNQPTALELARPRWMLILAIIFMGGAGIGVLAALFDTESGLDERILGALSVVVLSIPAGISLLRGGRYGRGFAYFWAAIFYVFPLYFLHRALRHPTSQAFIERAGRCSACGSRRVRWRALMSTAFQCKECGSVTEIVAPSPDIAAEPAPTAAAIGDAERWYYARGGQVHGPVPNEDLKRLAASGAIVASDQLCREATSEWIVASSVPHLFPSVLEAGQEVDQQLAAPRRPSLVGLRLDKYHPAVGGAVVGAFLALAAVGICLLASWSMLSLMMMIMGAIWAGFATALLGGEKLPALYRKRPGRAVLATVFALLFLAFWLGGLAAPVILRAIAKSAAP